MTQKEEIFNDRLKEIFIGDEVRGKSGFANLMRIKSDYFDEMFADLNNDVDDRVAKFDNSDDFREELYDKLYTFLKKYFSDSGSIYFTYTPLNSKIYEQVYDNREDVTVFWKTHMLYYVKTDTIWEELEIKNHELDGSEYDIKFDVSNIEGKTGNEKKDIEFQLGEVGSNKIIFEVERSTRGMSDNKVDELRRELKRKDIILSNEELRSVFSTFRKQNEVDFFINKDAEEFLKEQFDLWLKEYLLDENSVFEQERIEKIKAIRDTAYDIIDFVSQFEDELAKIWNKPKFALNSNYVVSLDKIVKQDEGWELVDRLQEHEGWDKQVEEWQELSIVGEEELSLESEQSRIDGRKLKTDYKHLPIDTKYFEDLEVEIVSMFENLDEKLDGRLIKSENYQALRTLREKYENSIDKVYIDPPYNASSSEIIYRNNFKHSTWLTLMENRVRAAKPLLKNGGVFSASIDDNEQYRFQMLMEELFSEEKQLTTTCVAIKPGGRQDEKFFPTAHEYLLSYTNNLDKVEISRLEPSEEKLSEFRYTDEYGDYKRRNFRRSGINSRREDRPGLWYPIYYDPEKDELSTEEKEDAVKILPKDSNGNEKCWRWSADTLEARQEKYIEIVESKGEYKIYVKERQEDYDGPKPTSLWSDSKYSNSSGTDALKSALNKTKEELVDFPKSPYYIKDLLEVTTDEDSTVMDYFLGSGTTTAVAHKMGREWIGIEQAEHFYNIILPRMKKVLAYDESGISDEDSIKESYNKENAGGFFKYYELEQYEQALKKCKYNDSKPFDFEGERKYKEYLFMNDQKMMEALKIDKENEKVDIDLTELYSGVDIAETLSNIKGKRIKKINENSVKFEDGETVQFDELKLGTIKPLIWW